MKLLIDIVKGREGGEKTTQVQINDKYLKSLCFGAGRKASPILKSVFMMHKAAVPHMKSGSSIINLASQAGRDGGGGGASAYATTKGAVMTFTRAMAKELGPDGIRVNALCPGLIATTFHDTFTPDNVRDMVANKTPLRREGTAEEVANLVGCLASSETSFVTGANFDINGGLAFS